MCGHKLVAQQIWMLVKARPHLLAEGVHRKIWFTPSTGEGKSMKAITILSENCWLVENISLDIFESQGSSLHKYYTLLNHSAFQDQAIYMTWKMGKFQIVHICTLGSSWMCPSAYSICTGLPHRVIPSLTYTQTHADRHTETVLHSCTAGQFFICTCRCRWTHGDLP